MSTGTLRTAGGTTLPIAKLPTNQDHTAHGIWHTIYQDTTYVTKHIPLNIPSYLAASAGAVPLKRAAVHATPAAVRPFCELGQ